LILASDGVSPLSKQTQQRGRRYKASQNVPNKNEFDNTQISVGTVWIDNLSKYIDFFIKKKIKEDKDWQKFEVIFSNERIPGEGEHKLVQFVKKYGTSNESYCIYGLDSDLYMLALATNKPNFYILKENLYKRNKNDDFILIDIDIFKDQLINLMKFDNTNILQNNQLIVYDWILVCFLLGNDFLPNIPSLEILEGGIELILETYKKICSKYGYLTKLIQINNEVEPDINLISLQKFVEEIGNNEKVMLENKLMKKNDYFPNEILDKCSKFNDKKYIVDLEKYKLEYYRKNFNIDNRNITDIQKICNEYILGLKWILVYYIKEVRDWNWIYPYHFAPFSSDLATYMNISSDIQTIQPIKISQPNSIFQQLLSILPPASSHFLPSPLNTLLNESSSLKEFYPDKFEVCLDHKKYEWEGVVILPIIDQEKLRKEYNKLYPLINEKDKKRNISGSTFIYKYDEKASYSYNCFFGKLLDYPICLQSKINFI
jgi:5'-3' exoribonuclease 1